MEASIFCHRKDGLGQRLRYLVLAMFVASKTNRNFKFTWAELNGESEFHDITPPIELFSEEFLEEHLVGLEDIKGLPLLELSNLSSFDTSILMKNDKFLNLESLDPKFIPDKGKLLTFFEKISFSDSVIKILNHVNDLNLSGGCVAIHLRGGDLIYGDFRKSERFNEKVIPIPVARDYALKIIEMGKTPIFFCQDDQAEASLNGIEGVFFSSQMKPKNVSSLQNAIFDIYLMSKCDHIFAGGSGFTDVASIIGGIEVLSLFDVYSKKEIIELIVLGLEESTFDNLQVSFLSYLCVYYTSAINTVDKFSSSMRNINRAIYNDPTNGMYKIRKIDLFVRHNFLLDLDDFLVSEVFNDLNCLSNNDLYIALSLKRSDGVFIHNRYIRNFASLNYSFRTFEKRWALLLLTFLSNAIIEEREKCGELLELLEVTNYKNIHSQCKAFLEKSRNNQ